MREACVAVLDVGKTHAKLTLCNPQGRSLARRARANAVIATPAYRALDTTGIESWLAATLTEFAALGEITAIVPVAHGAAAAVIRAGALACPPLDYEQPLPEELSARYRSLRDDFAQTGSPALPGGLNLGAQLYWLEELCPDLWRGDAAIVPWPQYWAWLLSGVAASEISSLGCHTDLWNPRQGQPSTLATSRGWARHLAPLRRASDVLGGLSPAWVRRTGLSPQTRVLCGLHDSNAALLAARNYAELAGRESTVVSTGTWFLALRSPATAQQACELPLAAGRDCLLNVDVQGNPIPSARFMGGRELELLCDDQLERLLAPAAQARLLDAASTVIRSGAMVLPTLAPGVGPFPHARFRWQAQPDTADERCAAAALYAALLTDTALGLLGSCERILIEGRFSNSAVYGRALATLRPDCSVYLNDAADGVADGARSLASEMPAAPLALRQAQPLDGAAGSGLADYRSRWRSRAENLEAAA